MERRSKGFVKLEWVCPNCNSRNPGPVKTCQNCGAPQPENVQFKRAAEEQLITDEKAIEVARAGADIHCGFCGARNPATATVCSQCGADLKEGKARQAGEVLQAAPTPPKAVTCTNCGTENPSSSLMCSKCGAPLPKATIPQPAPIQASAMPGVKPKSKAFNWLIAGGIGTFLVLCCAAILFLFVLPSRSVQGTVSNVSWQTSVPVQEVQSVNYYDQSGDPPSGAYNVSCRTDSQQVCEDKTVDKGNGYGEVVTECRTEDQKYCDYTLDEWKTIQTYDLNGTDLNPVYASPNISMDQRTGSASSTLTVYFDTSDGQIAYSPGSVDEFQQFQPGTTWTLKLNAVGGVVGVEP